MGCDLQLPRDNKIFIILFKYTYTHIYKHLPIDNQIFMILFKYIYIYIHTYTHTHTLTHRQRLLGRGDGLEQRARTGLVRVIGHDVLESLCVCVCVCMYIYVCACVCVYV